MGDPPLQEFALAGGRNTLPGYGYRTFAGDAFALLDIEASRDIVAPWIRGRLLASGGWVGDVGESVYSIEGEPLDGPARVRDLWTARRTAGFATSLGAGLGLGWDVLRLDLVRGLDRGREWQLLLSIQPRLWGVL
jgi:hypothetical protein